LAYETADEARDDLRARADGFGGRHGFLVFRIVRKRGDRAVDEHRFVEDRGELGVSRREGGPLAADGSGDFALDVNRCHVAPPGGWKISAESIEATGVSRVPRRWRRGWISRRRARFHPRLAALHKHR